MKKIFIIVTILFSMLHSSAYADENNISPDSKYANLKIIIYDDFFCVDSNDSVAIADFMKSVKACVPIKINYMDFDMPDEQILVYFEIIGEADETIRYEMVIGEFNEEKCFVLFNIQNYYNEDVLCYNFHDIKPIIDKFIDENKIVFTDIDEKSAEYPIIQTLAAMDVIKGYEDGSFKPENY